MSTQLKTLRRILFDELELYRTGKTDRLRLLAITKAATEIIDAYRVEFIYDATKKILSDQDMPSVRSNNQLEAKCKF